MAGFTPWWARDEPGSGEAPGVDALSHWRARVLSASLFALLALGLVALVPGLWIAFERRLWGVVLVDVAAYGWVLVATLAPGLSLRARAWNLVALLYGLGVVLTLAYGTAGAGRLWLLTVPVTTSLLLGLRPGIAALGVVCVTWVALLFPLRAAPPPGADLSALSPGMWFTVGLNFLLLAALPTIGLGVLLEGLERTTQRLRRSLDELGASHAANDRLSARLQRAETLEAIGTVTGSVAHDFNNLLMAIGATNEVLASELEPGDVRREHVHEVADAVRRGAALTRQLLAVGRREDISPERVDLGAVVEGMVPMLAHLVAPRCQLVFEREPEPLVTRVDPGQVERVLLNLVVNARDASPGGGHIQVCAGRADVEDDGDPIVAPGRYVTLEVRDQGVGMDEGTRARVFEPFFPTKGRGEGTGLGLATVWGIARQNGGVVRCESAPGRGATFTVLVPAHDDAAADTPTEGTPAHEPGTTGVREVRRPAPGTGQRRTG